MAQWWRSRRDGEAASAQGSCEESLVPPIAEREAIALLRAVLDVPTSAFDVGNGDDAAVFHARGQLVWSVDDSVEGRHFKRHWLSWADVGWRATHAAASDLVAMGARPLAGLCSLQLPEGFTRPELRQLARGQRSASDALELPIVGGNITGGDVLRLTTSVLGRTKRPWLRGGGQVGDGIWHFGPLGSAGAGLRILSRGLRAPRGLGASYEACVAGFRRPCAQLQALQGLQRRMVHAAIDISDGLAADLQHIAEASHLELRLDPRALADAVPESVSRCLAVWGEEPLAFVLGSGEDYGLVVLSPRNLAPVGGRWLGQAGPCTTRHGRVLCQDRIVSAGFQHGVAPTPRARGRGGPRSAGLLGATCRLRARPHP